MSQKARLIKAYVLPLKPKAAKQLAEIDKSIRKVSDRDKRKLIKDGLSVKSPNKIIIKKVDIKKIVHSTYFIRSKARETYDNFDMVTELEPIKVVVVKEIKGYFLVDGEGRLEFARRKGEKQVEVEIIGTIVCQSQIGMARGKEMVKFKKPLTPLELAQGLMQLEDQLKRDFGEDAFFSHGGDRKAAVESKESLSAYIAETLGLKKSTVKILIRFGRNVGPIGIAGLLTNGQIANISLGEINQINAGLKDSDILKKIDERLKPMLDEGVSQENLIKAAGELAYNIIDQVKTQKEGKTQIYDNDNNDDDNMDETPTDDLPIPPDKGGPNNKNKLKAHKKTKTKIKPSEIINIISNIESVLKKLKNDLNKCKDVEEVDKPIFEARWKKFTEFLSNLCTKVTNAGLS